MSADPEPPFQARISEYQASNVSARISNEVNEFQFVVRVAKKAFGPKRLFRCVDQGGDLPINSGEDDVIDSVDVLMVNTQNEGTLFPLLLAGKADAFGCISTGFSKALDFADMHCLAVASQQERQEMRACVTGGQDVENAFSSQWASRLLDESSLFRHGR